MVFHKIKSLVDVNEDSLYEIFMNYDFNNTGYMLVADMPRAFKRLGILHPEPHLPLLKEAGGIKE